MSGGKFIRVNYRESYTYSFFCPSCHVGTVVSSHCILNVLECENCHLVIARWEGQITWSTVNEMAEKFSCPTLLE